MATTPMTITKPIDSAGLNLKEHVVSINRVTKVVKGGKNLSFSALVVVGDPDAKVVGYGTGKAKEVPAAIKKAIEAAKKNLRRIHVQALTIPHRCAGPFRRRPGAAEARARGHRRDRRRSGARRHRGGGHRQRATKSIGSAQPAQRRQGDRGGARAVARQARRGRIRGLAVEKL